MVMPMLMTVKMMMMMMVIIVMTMMINVTSCIIYSTHCFLPTPSSKSMGDSERKRIVATMDMRPISEVYENELR